MVDPGSMMFHDRNRDGAMTPVSSRRKSAHVGAPGIIPQETLPGERWSARVIRDSYLCKNYKGMRSVAPAQHQLDQADARRDPLLA
jgi:hypothetical protein